MSLDSTKLDQAVKMADALSTRAERIAAVRRLYDRPGTPGEKAAAAEALRRLGVTPEDPPSLQESRPLRVINRYVVTLRGRGGASYVANVSARGRSKSQAIDDVKARAARDMPTVAAWFVEEVLEI